RRQPRVLDLLVPPEGGEAFAVARKALLERDADAVDVEQRAVRIEERGALAGGDSMAPIYAKRRAAPGARRRSAAARGRPCLLGRYFAPCASSTHFFVKLVLAAPASFFSAALASHAAVASLSHFFTKLFLAAPASFFSAAIAAQLPPPPPPAIAPLAAMAGASLCEVANAEVERASTKAADSEISCFINVSG